MHDNLVHYLPKVVSSLPSHHRHVNSSIGEFKKKKDFRLAQAAWKDKNWIKMYSCH